METLLITGSRDTNPKMLNTAIAAAKRAHELGWRIIVGDAHGVDQAVVETCEAEGIPHIVVGISDKPRNTNTLDHYVNSKQPGFLKRDDWMVDRATKCLAIWNGSSRGTKHTYDRAVEKGLEAWLIDYS